MLNMITLGWLVDIADGQILFIYFNRADVCESKVEIVTPYWASNSNGKVDQGPGIQFVSLQTLIFFDQNSNLISIAMNCH